MHGIFYNRTLFVILETIACNENVSFCYTVWLCFLFSSSFVWIFSSSAQRDEHVDISRISLARTHSDADMVWHWNLFAKRKWKKKKNIQWYIFRTWNEYATTYTHIGDGRKRNLSVAWKSFSDLSIRGDDITRNHATATFSHRSHYYLCIHKTGHGINSMPRLYRTNARTHAYRYWVLSFQFQHCESCAHNIFALDRVIYRYIGMINATNRLIALYGNIPNREEEILFKSIASNHSNRNALNLFIVIFLGKVQLVSSISECDATTRTCGIVYLRNLLSEILWTGQRATSTSFATTNNSIDQQ